MCKQTIRLKAKERFSSEEFIDPLFDKNLLIDQFLSTSIQKFLFLSSPSSPSLPYFMAIFKIHKNAFRWLTNAHECLFSPITKCITLALQSILHVLKDYTEELHTKLFTFSQVKTNALWLIESQYDFLIHLPHNITSCHTFDVTSCYEAIPHTGKDSLMEALNFLCKLCSKQGFIGFYFDDTFKCKQTLQEIKKCKLSLF